MAGSGQDLNIPVCHPCEQKLVSHLRFPKIENKTSGFGIETKSTCRAWEPEFKSPIPT